jgi:hypothetical protein
MAGSYHSLAPACKPATGAVVCWTQSSRPRLRSLRSLRRVTSKSLSSKSLSSLARDAGAGGEVETLTVPLHLPAGGVGEVATAADRVDARPGASATKQHRQGQLGADRGLFGKTMPGP